MKHGPSEYDSSGPFYDVKSPGTGNLNRELTKINYKIHADAIKEHLVPDDISTRAQSFTYANEADVFSVKRGALSQSQTFQMTIPEKRGIVKNDVVENYYLCKE